MSRLGTALDWLGRQTASPAMLIFVAIAPFPIYLLSIIQRPLYRPWLEEEMSP